MDQPKLRKGVRVLLTSMGYKGVKGTLTNPARSEPDGTHCWYVVPMGKHTELRFRVDEFEVTDET